MIYLFIFYLEAKEEAFDLFEEMLSRKEKADSTRNALSVLQRFRFLFNLPANIEKNIRKVRKALLYLNNPLCFI